MRKAGFAEVYKSHVGLGAFFDIYMAHMPVMTMNHDIAHKLAPTLKTEYHLCGHVHEAWARRDRIINVGVDVRNFRPVTLDELLQSEAT